MSKIIHLLWLLCLCAAPAGAETIAFRHVSVIPMTEDIVLPDQMVVVRDGVIEAVAPEGSRPAPARRRDIDGRGLFLMPGLIDFHVHSIAPVELWSYLLHGQTSVITLGGEGLALRRRMGPQPPVNIYTTGITLDGNPPTNRRFHAVAAGDAAAILAAERRDGADLIKIYGRMGAEVFRETTAEAHRQGLAVVAHLPRGLDPETAIGGVDIVAHGEEFLQFLGSPPTDEAIDRIATLTRRLGTAVIPNLVAYAAMPRHAAQLQRELADPDLRFLPPSVYQEWLAQNNRYATRPNIPDFVRNLATGLDVLRRLTARLHAAGVPLLAGTDAPIFCFPGRCLLEELALLRSAGLSPYEVLRTATANPGRVISQVMHRPERVGVVAAGARADLILLGANPLADLQALNDMRGAMTAGRWRQRDEIAAARDGFRTELTQERASVDRYEAMLARMDMAGIAQLLRTLPADRNALNENVLIFDALILESESHRPQAIALLEGAARVLPRSFGLWNELGRMRAESGDAAGARAAFQRSLVIAPRNAVAQTRLAALAGSVP